MKKIFLCVLAGLIILPVLLFSQEYRNITSPNEVVENGFIQICGMSDSNQSRYNAIRSAQVVTLRELVETLKGTFVNSFSEVNQGRVNIDKIKATAEGFVKHHIKVFEQFYPEEGANRGYAKVCYRLNLRGENGIYQAYYTVMKGEGYSAQMKNQFLQARQQVVSKYAQNIKTDYDGLIIDTSGVNFIPSFDSRVYTDNGKIVYGPEIPEPNIGAEKGVINITRGINKAKALLSSSGVKNPLIVKATSVLNRKNIQTSKEDFINILKYDAKANFLAQANVVFAVK